MSHDLYASWATAEVTRMITASPEILFSAAAGANLSVFANRESGRKWPIPDGRISAEVQNDKYEVAIELKRTNEGLHGVLTAIGQSHAYLHKGYSGSAIIIPNTYDSFPLAGNYVSDVIARTKSDLPIGVFTYDVPDTTNPSPFYNKIKCLRKIGLTNQSIIPTGTFLSNQKSSTQWAHLREGSTEAFAFMKYLQTAKQINATNPVIISPNIPQELLDAVGRIKPLVDPVKYLSNANGIELHDQIWRNFWFDNVLIYNVATIWIKQGNTYIINAAKSKLKLKDGTFKLFFASRSDSKKSKIVNDLNKNLISEDKAWENFAINIHKRAHSYREDIDSGLAHLGLIDSYGKPSETGYKFVDACERTNDCYTGKPHMIFGASILQTGSLGAFLHYVYKVSEIEFKKNPLAFSKEVNGRKVFETNKYLLFIRNELANTLKVMNTASIRNEKNKRKPFQGELAILRNFAFVSSFRIGVGLEVNWPLVQDFLSYEL